MNDLMSWKIRNWGSTCSVCFGRNMHQCGNVSETFSNPENVLQCTCMYMRMHTCMSACAHTHTCSDIHSVETALNSWYCDVGYVCVLSVTNLQYCFSDLNVLIL
jgi:hypothetical protein